ncbi:MAG: TatD family hydrolase [Trebonia sp.]
MPIFDPHIHMSSRTTGDYRAMYAAGVRTVVEPSFWVGQPRTSADTMADYFASLLGWEPFRAAQYGITHYCAIALNPKEANDPRCAAILDRLPGYLDKDGVVAVGEVGFDAMTDEEEHAFATQLDLAAEHSLPVLVHTPHRAKLDGTLRSLALIEKSGLPPGRVVLDHLNELTVGPAADSGCWMGFSIYPDSKMEPDRMVRIMRNFGTDRILVNSAADWGNSDPLLTRATADAMRGAGFGDDDIDQVFWRNPAAFYGQSGRLRPGPAPDGQYAGNTVARGDARG